MEVSLRHASSLLFLLTLPLLHFGLSDALMLLLLVEVKRNEKERMQHPHSLYEWSESRKALRLLLMSNEKANASEEKARQEGATYNFSCTSDAPLVSSFRFSYTKPYITSVHEEATYDAPDSSLFLFLLLSFRALPEEKSVVASVNSHLDKSSRILSHPLSPPLFLSYFFSCFNRISSNVHK